MANQLTDHSQALVALFPVNCRVIDFPGLPSERYGTVVSHQPMWGKQGLYPVVQWDQGYTCFSSPEWGLKQASTRVDRLRERISQECPHCTVIERGRSVLIKTPGAEFRVANGKLYPYIPSVRYKAIAVIVAAIWSTK